MSPSRLFLVPSAILAATLYSPAHAQTCKGTDAGFRILTYNVQMIEVPPCPDSDLLCPKSNESTYGMTHEARASAISHEVLAHDPDVVVFNEVQLDGPRERFVEELGDRYPWHVSYIGNSDFQDSGLMLFSQYPFDTLPDHRWVGLDNVDAEADGSPWEEVAFADFDDAAEAFAQGECKEHPVLCEIDDDTPGSSYPDNIASKGAGLVRLRQPCTWDPINVVFTHLQADYHDDDQATFDNRVYNRGFQLQAIQQLIDETLGQSVEDEAIYIVGDVNVDANPYHNVPVPLGIATEWNYHFDSASSYDDPVHGYFACGDMTCPGTTSRFIDTWGFETSPDDLGRTGGGDEAFVWDGPTNGKRLDYILRSGMDGSRCADWMRIAWPVTGTNGLYSDHLPVEGYFNHTSTHCSAADPRIVSEDANGDDDYSGTLSFAGAFAWHRIDTPGTWSVYLDEADRGFEIYAATDLSRPLAPTHYAIEGEGIWNLDDPPYYVRVNAADAGTGAMDLTGYGPYTAHFHLHQCDEPEDACLIRPGVPREVLWPGTSMTPTDDSQYFWFRTEGSSNGVFPTLEILSSKDPGALFTTYTPSVSEAMWPYAPVQMAFAADPNTGITSGTVTGLVGDPTGPRTYLVRINRSGLMAFDTAHVEWRTDLTYLDPLVVYNIKEDDDTWCCDEIWIRTELDKGAVPATQPCEVEDGTAFSYFAKLDEGQEWPAWPLGLDAQGKPLSFVQDVRLSLADDDGPGCDDHFASLGSDLIEALDPEDVGTGGHLYRYWSDDPDSEKADYVYKMSYTLSHESPQ